MYVQTISLQASYCLEATNFSFVFCFPMFTTSKYVYAVYVCFKYIYVCIFTHVTRRYDISVLRKLGYSTVGISTDQEQDSRGIGVRFLVGTRFFSSARGPARLWGPPNLLFNGYEGIFSPRVKRLGRKADQSLPTSAEVKKTSNIVLS
jgi:hypothetical protein